MYDQEGTLILREWDLDGSFDLELAWSDTPLKEVPTYSEGTYDVTLRVTDDDGSTDTVTHNNHNARNMGYPRVSTRNNHSSSNAS